MDSPNTVGTTKKVEPIGVYAINRGLFPWPIFLQEIYLGNDSAGPLSGLTSREVNDLGDDSVYAGRLCVSRAPVGVGGRVGAFRQVCQQFGVHHRLRNYMKFSSTD